MFLSKSGNCICPNCKMYLFKLPASICHPVSHLRQQNKYMARGSTSQPRDDQNQNSNFVHSLQPLLLAPTKPIKLWYRTTIYLIHQILFGKIEVITNHVWFRLLHCYCHCFCMHGSLSQLLPSLILVLPQTWI